MIDLEMESNRPGRILSKNVNLYITCHYIFVPNVDQRCALPS